MMQLEGKRILLFGGSVFLIERLMPVFLSSGASLTWLHNIKGFSLGNKKIESYYFEDIQDSSAYEEYLTRLNEGFLFDGLVFAQTEGALRPLKLTKPKFANSLIEINCMCFIELVRVLDKDKRLKNGSSVVVYSSISSLLGLKTKLAYGISKAALNSSVLHLASELSNKRIRVNAILKGALTTDLNHEHVRNMFAIGEDESGSQQLGLTEPEELAELTLFLLSDKVRTMSGALINLDGGYSLT
jgi:NAD(P)-dependent dehydrogenase (short-subunit alcohol dehydrogenase family)